MLSMSGGGGVIIEKNIVKLQPKPKGQELTLFSPCHNKNKNLTKILMKERSWRSERTRCMFWRNSCFARSAELKAKIRQQLELFPLFLPYMDRKNATKVDWVMTRCLLLSFTPQLGHLLHANCYSFVLATVTLKLETKILCTDASCLGLSVNKNNIHHL